MLSPAHLTRLIHEWEEKKAELARVKAEELALRVKLVAEGFDPDIRTGTQNLLLKTGDILKAKKRLNYSFTSTAALKTVLVRMEDIGPDGAFVTQRIVSWSPRLVLGEYHKLTELPNGALYRQMLDPVIVVTDATPELELKKKM
jgi:hypothetical protein